MQIRIKWKSKLTGYEGHGDWFESSSLTLLTQWCIYGNGTFPDLKHEVEFNHSKK